MGIKKLPEFLQSVQVEPRDREVYADALANGMSLSTWLKIHRDDLLPYDVLVMMRIECERTPPREHILTRLMGRYRVERNYVEEMALVGMFRG